MFSTKILHGTLVSTLPHDTLMCTLAHDTLMSTLPHDTLVSTLTGPIIELLNLRKSAKEGEGVFGSHSYGAMG